MAIGRFAFRARRLEPDRRADSPWAARCMVDARPGAGFSRDDRLRSANATEAGPRRSFPAPLVAVELWFDMRSRSRRLIPELAGSIGIGSIATSIALADGASTRVAWGLWVVVAARSVAAIPYVRTQIQRTKSRPSPNWHSDVAQLAAINLGALRLAPKPAAVIGIQQTIFARR